MAGMGDMAVSNSIGSNIFDVLLGLGFPWALRTLIVSYGSVVTPAVSLPHISYSWLDHYLRNISTLLMDRYIGIYLAEIYKQGNNLSSLFFRWRSTAEAWCTQWSCCWPQSCSLWVTFKFIYLTLVPHVEKVALMSLVVSFVHVK